MPVSTYPPSVITLGQVSLSLPASISFRVRGFHLCQENFVCACIHLSPFYHYLRVGQFRFTASVSGRVREFSLCQEKFVCACIHLPPFYNYLRVGQFRFTHINIWQGQRIQFVLGEICLCLYPPYPPSHTYFCRFVDLQICKATKIKFNF